VDNRPHTEAAVLTDDDEVTTSFHEERQDMAGVAALRH
jgi:hypothetical protein